MYGALESVAVLWRLRSHRDIIIIIIISHILAMWIRISLATLQQIIDQMQCTHMHNCALQYVYELKCQDVSAVC